YHLADHIIAAWPQALYQPSWLCPYTDKTSYVGGISRFDGRAEDLGARDEIPAVLVLHGAGGSTLRLDTVNGWQQQYPEYRWRTL
ncbi:hypothetical protein C6A85_38745, partial [Mycobacterium sp. ITM-2017-0098]